jgi:hypothetical protein
MPAREEQEKGPDMPDKRKTVHPVDAFFLHKTATSMKMLDFKWLSIKYFLDFSAH